MDSDIPEGRVLIREGWQIARLVCKLSRPPVVHDRGLLVAAGKIGWRVCCEKLRMDTTTIVRSEETGADYSPPNDFNIAQAFPVTDRLVTKVEREKRRRQMERLAKSPTTYCLAGAILGFLIGASLARR